MSAELGLAVVGVIDITIKLAGKVIKAYKIYRDADSCMDDKIVLMESLWTKVEIQLRFLSKISNYLTEELAQSHFHLVQKLKGKLVQTISQLETTAGESKSTKTKTSDFLRKWRFALIKGSLDELVAELEAWQQRFDPTWYLIILIGNNVLDSALQESKQNQEVKSPSEQNSSPLDNMLALRSTLTAGVATSNGQTQSQPNKRDSINLNIAGLKGAKETTIPFTMAKAVVRLGSNKLLITESVAAPPGSISQVKVDVESLARKLQQIDPDIFGLLRCYGLVKHKDPVTQGLASVEVVYRTPPNSEPPSSLRHHLLRQGSVSLSAIVRIAKHLVRSVSYIHTCDFVHKNIRPDNVLIFPSHASPLGGSVALVGFTQFRNANFQTNLCGDSAWYRNLYRHPQRQGAFVQERYKMQHDIYSLGVCLLEIGLWRTFVWYPSHDDNSAPVPGLALGLGIRDEDFETVNSTISARIKEHLASLAARELPPRLGDVYTDIVLACLSCLDPGNSTFGPEEGLTDEDGIIIGVRFVEKILGRINEISI